jgi:glycosyltransferase involved in cell wall biosynthesis
MAIDTPLRVSIYVASLTGGGAERAAAVLATGFREAGHEVQLLVDMPGDENRGFLDPRIPVRRLWAGHMGSVAGLVRHLVRREADVILAIGGAPNVKLIAARTLCRDRTPAVLSYHGRSDVGRGRLGAAAFQFAPALARRAGRVVCVSDALVRHLVDDWAVPPGQVCCIPNAIPVERARPARDVSDLRRRDAVVLAVGRLVPEKDFATLLRAVAQLGDHVRLTLIGEGPERAALTALASELGVAHRVDLPGYAAEPWAAYAQARVFALSSRSEGFGNVIVEALASGLPVVSTSCGGPDEILGSGRWGCLIPAGDPATLARSLAAALADPGDPAPRRARADRYRTQAVVAEYIALFRDLVRV